MNKSIMRHATCDMRHATQVEKLGCEKSRKLKLPLSFMPPVELCELD